jgi:hypothetical protein
MEIAMNHDEGVPQTWKKLFRDAVLEVNSAEFLQKLAMVEQAIDARFRELEYGGDAHRTELMELGDASRTIELFRTQHEDLQHREA